MRTGKGGFVSRRAASSDEHTTLRVEQAFRAIPIELSTRQEARTTQRNPMTLTARVVLIAGLVRRYCFLRPRHPGCAQAAPGQRGLCGRDPESRAVPAESAVAHGGRGDPPPAMGVTDLLAMQGVTDGVAPDKAMAFVGLPPRRRRRARRSSLIRRIRRHGAARPDDELRGVPQQLRHEADGRGRLGHDARPGRRSSLRISRTDTPRSARRAIRLPSASRALPMRCQARGHCGH